MTAAAAAPVGAATALLGPQRFLTTAGTVARDLAPEGRIATVTAGWREREADDAELHDVMRGDTWNLRLYTRLLDVLSRDDRFAGAARTFNEAVDELAGLYSLRLQRTLDTVYAAARRTVRAELSDAALSDGVASLKAVDEWYLTQLEVLREDLAGPTVESELVAFHRVEVRGIVGGSALVAIAGGHVGVLLRCLQLFLGRLPAELPVVAWSAGAMAVTDRVVLYNDRGPLGLRGAEVWDHGLGRVPGVVALPHARRRLRLEDPMTVQVLVRRFGPARCVLLDEGARVVLVPGGELPDGTRLLTDHGTVGTVGGLP